MARRCVYSLPCKLRAPTLRCAATSLAQGNTTVDGSSGIAKVQTDSDIDDRQPSACINAVHDTSSSSSSNGFYGDRSSSSGAAGAINGTYHAFEPPLASESGITDDDQYSVSSMSASSAKYRLKQDLDRERSLSSSSRIEATDGVSASEASSGTQPAASSPESPSDASSMPGEEWHPRQERLKRLREGQDGSLNDKERLRRLRISMANKGKQPWNTGRKHSPGEAQRPSKLPCLPHSVHSMAACFLGSSAAAPLLQALTAPTFWARRILCTRQDGQDNICLITYHAILCTMVVFGLTSVLFLLQLR